MNYTDMFPSHICMQKLYSHRSPEELRYSDIYHEYATREYRTSFQHGTEPVQWPFDLGFHILSNNRRLPIRNSDSEIQELLERTDISRNIVVKLLIEREFPLYVAPHINICHVEHLLFITNASKLRAVDRSRHYEMYAAVKIFRNASYRQSFRYLKKAIGKDSLSIANRKLINLPVALYHLGDYQNALNLVANDINGNGNLNSAYPNILIFSYFYTENWKALYKECCKYLLCRPLKDVIGLENEVHGLRVFSLIKLGQTDDYIIIQARKMLNEAKEDPIFRRNPIISYCATELGEEIENSSGDQMNVEEWNSGIMYLFKGMIHEFQNNEYGKALLMYHQCNFYSTHALHYLRAYYCYQKIGLYRRAHQCLLKARDVWTGKTITKYIEKLSILQRLKHQYMHCNVCGKAAGWNQILFKCGGCLGRYYCSRVCQKIDWNLKGHRKHCSKRHRGFRNKLKRARQSPFMNDCDRNILSNRHRRT